MESDDLRAELPKERVGAAQKHSDLTSDLRAGGTGADLRRCARPKVNGRPQKQHRRSAIGAGSGPGISGPHRWRAGPQTKHF